MNYFQRLRELLQIEKEEDRRSFRELSEKLPVTERREAGTTWYPVAIRDSEIGRGDYLTVEVERTTHHHVLHQLRFGMSASLFSQHDPIRDRIEGIITNISGNRLKLSLRTEELPDWSRNGKLGIDALFDENAYKEMEAALQAAQTVAGGKKENRLVTVLTGEAKPTFSIGDLSLAKAFPFLNPTQQQAVAQILSANELSIVHGPPGTGKTTTLVQAIKWLVGKEGERVLVTAPSNAAVDLLSEKLFDEGLNVVRVGNPARVNEKQMALTMDSRISEHPRARDIKRLKKQAAEYRDLAQKYKRSFGPAEREQRKALFAEAKAILTEAERLEEYLVNDTLDKAQVITATLVGANHYMVRGKNYRTVVIDEAGQAIEPACWIPILKAQKVIFAGDHLQLPPTIKSVQAAGELSITLLEKLVALHPEAVTLLEEQYRMNEIIGGFSSREFYYGKLRPHFSVADQTLFTGDSPLLFIDTAGCGFEERREGNGLSNPEEAAFLVMHLRAYAKELLSFYTADAFPSFGVIAPYRHQVELLREAIGTDTALQSLLPAITVNTIDSFQGQERDAIYISLTRSNAENTIGFLSELRRTNVALTRARKKLVVIGDSATLSGFPFYSDFIQYAQEREAYASAWEFMEGDTSS